jgi:CDP-glucose 4,6-dehydratase
MRILVTGHTGFKGATLAHLLIENGLEVCGFSDTARELSLYSTGGLKGYMHAEFIGKIESFPDVSKCLDEFKPQIIFHLAAQPIVHIAKHEPLQTFMANAIGTLNILEAARKLKLNSQIVLVTTDKIYKDRGLHPHKETSELYSDEPYGASKVAAELIAHSFRTLSKNEGLKWATARSGNIVGFGDDGPSRLLPDLLHAKMSSQVPEIRSPNSSRPWTYILDSLSGYIDLANYLLKGGHEGAFNFGPRTTETVSVSEVSQIVLGNQKPFNLVESEFYEQKHLLLDSSYARKVIGWTPLYNSREAISETVRWNDYFHSENVNPLEMLKKVYTEYFLLGKDLGSKTFETLKSWNTK